MEYLNLFNKETGYDYSKDYIYNPVKTYRVLKWWNVYAKECNSIYFPIGLTLMFSLLIGGFIGGVVILIGWALSNLFPICLLFGLFIGVSLWVYLSWDFWKMVIESLSNDFNEDVFSVKYPDIILTEDSGITSLQFQMQRTYNELYSYQSTHKNCKALYYPFKLKCVKIAESIEVYLNDYSDDPHMRENIISALSTIIYKMNAVLNKSKKKERKALVKRLEKLKND